jgi:hypothetical protein
MYFWYSVLPDEDYSGRNTEPNYILSIYTSIYKINIFSCGCWSSSVSLWKYLSVCLHAFKEGLHSIPLVTKRWAPRGTYCYGADCQLHITHEICFSHYRLSMPCYMSNHRHYSIKSISLLFVSKVRKVVDLSVWSFRSPWITNLGQY